MSSNNTFRQYFKDVKEARIKYGESTIVFIQIGGFYEVYGSPNEPGTEDTLDKLRDILNMRKGTKQKPADMKLSFMGFPLSAYETHKHAILRAGYSIVRYDQDGPSENGKRVDRGVGIVETPGTYLDSNSLTNNLMSIYVKCVENTKNKSCSIGLSSIDLRTGHCQINEIHSLPNNFHYPLEETYRCMYSYNPVEIRIYHEKVSNEMQELIHNFLELSRFKAVWQEVGDAAKIDYQEEFLVKLSENENVFEDWGLDRYQFATTALVSALKYIDEYHKTALKRIQAPEHEKKNYMVLANNAIRQLKVVPPLGESGLCSLFSVIDKTKSLMGRRLLKHRILRPFIRIRDIKLEHTLIEEVGSLSDNIEKQLKTIDDLDRFYRYIVLFRLKPADFAERIYESHKSIISLFKLIEGSNCETLKSMIVSSKKLQKCMNEYLEIFDVAKMKDEEDFFKIGHNDKIDKLQKINSECDDTFNRHMIELDKCIPKKKATNGKVEENCIKFDYNEVDGYYLHTTKARSNLIKSAKKDKYKYKDYKLKTKLFNEELETASENKRKCLAKLKPMVLCQYQKEAEKWFSKHANMLEEINLMVSEIDVAYSLYMIAKLNKYVKPIVKSPKNGSYMNLKDMRNPLIEKRTDEKYIPNDVELNQNGMLLYGPNMAGKSTYMRGVGLTIILAQIGSYLPISSGEFAPYDHLITRIMGEDDELRGRSSFMVEISELRIMLKNSNKNTLALGDEICRGTGHLDAVSLVLASIQHMTKYGSSFVFTTHLHDLKYRPEILELIEKDKLFLKHIEVSAISGNELKFNRKLQDGGGPENYGIEIAKSLGLDDEFVEVASKIRKELEDTSLVSENKSKYNRLVRKTECEECGSRKDLQTDHIVEQSEADENGFIDHRHKNHVSNLKVLCKVCHAKKTKKRYN